MSASVQMGSHSHHMAFLVLQLGVMIIAARLGGALFTRLKITSVLGELCVGILIGPYLIGGFPIPGLPEGLFPKAAGPLPVSMELYGVATIASILLLFMAGLKTDLKLFMRFSAAGTLVGVGGVLFSFIAGDLIAALLLESSWLDPRALFLGVMSTATSVGLSVRILLDKKRFDTPEGVTILAGAVIDDILGIILLAVVVSISGLGDDPAAIDWRSIGLIAAKTLGVWLAVTALVIAFAHPIARVLRIGRSLQMTSILALALALLLAGFFEQVGLAMIIGAYVMGLSLSKTDLSLTIQEYLQPLHNFLVPIFFVTMGMFVDLSMVFSIDALIFGSIYTGGAVIAKLLGAGVPALLLDFRPLGALRIGLGMIPRSEVTLIMAGIGLATGIIDSFLFSIAVIMTLTSALIAPMVLSWALSLPGRGTRKEIQIHKTGTLAFSFPTSEMAHLMESKVISEFQQEGFMVNRLSGEKNIYRLQKKRILIHLHREAEGISFESHLDQQPLIKILMYEMLVEMNAVVEKVKDMVRPQDLKPTLTPPQPAKSQYQFGDLFHPECISMKMTATTRDEAITELLELLHENGIVRDLPQAQKAVFERENAISTGMDFGIAIPHGRIQEIDKLHVAVGFSPNGIDFDAIDGQPSHVFVLTVVPKDQPVPYIQFLAFLMAAMGTPEKVAELRSFEYRQQVIDFFAKKK